MKNREFYKEQIENFKGYGFCNEFVKPVILKKQTCDGYCITCRLLQAIWLDEKYVEPATLIDWSKVAVDTKILVRNTSDAKWFRRRFAKYENGHVCAWACGADSWSADGDEGSWKYAKLAEEE